MTKFNTEHTRRWAFEEMRYEQPRALLHANEPSHGGADTARCTPVLAATVARVDRPGGHDYPARFNFLEPS